MSSIPPARRAPLLHSQDLTVISCSSSSPPPPPALRAASLLRRLLLPPLPPCFVSSKLLHPACRHRHLQKKTRQRRQKHPALPKNTLLLVLLWLNINCFLAKREAASRDRGSGAVTLHPRLQLQLLPHKMAKVAFGFKKAESSARYTFLTQI